MKTIDGRSRPTLLHDLQLTRVRKLHRLFNTGEWDVRDLDVVTRALVWRPRHVAVSDTMRDETNVRAFILCRGAAVVVPLYTEHAPDIELVSVVITVDEPRE